MNYVLSIAFAALTMNLVQAQGDTCDDPIPVEYLEQVESFDLGTHSASGFTGASSGCANAPGLHRDRFYAFTAEDSGPILVALSGCLSTGLARIYEGMDCSSTCVDSQIIAPECASDVILSGLIQGSQYLLQLSTSDMPDVAYFTILSLAGDTCDDPIDLNDGHRHIHGFGSTVSGHVPPSPACVVEPLIGIWGDRFFAYTPTESGLHRIAVVSCRGLWDMALYEGTDCSAACFLHPQFQHLSICASVAYVTLSANQPYLLHMGWSVMNYVELRVGAIPHGDDCNSPIQVVGQGAPAITFDNNLMWLPEGAPSSTCLPAVEPLGFDTFFHWTPTAFGDFQIDTIGSAGIGSSHLRAQLLVHTGQDCSATCLSNDMVLYFEDDRQGFVEVHDAHPGDSYLIQVATWAEWVEPTDGVLNIRPLPPRPVNDTCATATPISGLGAFPFDSRAARTDGPISADPTCTLTEYTTSPPRKDVYFQWTVPLDGDYQFSTAGSGIPMVLQAYLGTGCGATCLARALPSEDDHLLTLLELADLQAGESVLLQLGGRFHEGTETGRLRVAYLDGGPPNPTCATALLVVGELAVDFNNVGLFADLAEEHADPECLPPSRDVYYRWTPTCDGDFRIHTEGSALGDTVLAVYEGWDCLGDCGVVNDDIDAVGGNRWSEVVLTGVTAWTPYLVQVGCNPVTCSGGFGTLSFERLGGPCSDPNITEVCAPAQPHAGGDDVHLMGGFREVLGWQELHLEATQGPVGRTGMLVGSAAPSMPVPLGQGLLCLAQPIHRYNLHAANAFGVAELNSVGRFNTEGSGMFETFSGTSFLQTGFDVPLLIPSPQGIVGWGPGDTLVFQLWYRDTDSMGVHSSNLSNALVVTLP